MVLLGNKKPPQNKLTARVGGFVAQLCGMFLVVGLHAEDGCGYELRDGQSSSIHEGGGEEGVIGMQRRYLWLVALRGW